MQETLTTRPDLQDLAVLIDRFTRAIAQNPDDDVTRLNLGNALFYAGRFEEAEPHFRAVHRRHGQEPMVLLNFLGTLGELGHRAEGRKLARDATRLFAASAELAVTHAANLLKLGLFAEAEAFCTRLSTRYPGVMEYNRGMARLFLGKWAPGWRDMEHRPTGLLRPGVPNGFSAWNGRAVSGRLYVEMEQGFGDAILFARYLPLLKSRVPDVVVIARPPLQRLISQIVPGTAIVSPGTAPDTQGAPLVRVMSLPYMLATPVPDTQPYITVPDDLVTAWRQRLGLEAAENAVGVAWSTQSESYNAGLKSLPLESLAPLQAAGRRLVAVQRPGQDQVLAREWGITVLPEDIDFLDTAAVMTLLSAVVSIDTAAAHLAGAVGCPLYLNYGPHLDWRWPPGKDNLWYRGARMFRARDMDDYRQQFGAIAAVLPPA